MSNFVPCPACNRHVLSAETACPFCTAALPESLRLQTPRPAAARASQPRRAPRGGRRADGRRGVQRRTPRLRRSIWRRRQQHRDRRRRRHGGADGPQDGSAVALYGAAPAPLEAAPADESAAAPTTGKS